MKNKIVVAFFATFLGLAALAATLYFGWGIDIRNGWVSIVLLIIMFGVPTFVYYKNKK